MWYAEPGHIRPSVTASCLQVKSKVHFDFLWSFKITRLMLFRLPIYFRSSAVSNTAAQLNGFRRSDNFWSRRIIPRLAIIPGVACTCSLRQPSIHGAISLSRRLHTSLSFSRQLLLVKHIRSFILNSRVTRSNFYFQIWVLSISPSLTTRNSKKFSLVVLQLQLRIRLY
jgi:hypothetical protein